MTEAIIGMRTGKVYLARMDLMDKIRKAEEELKTAGPVHRRDLRKHIKRMTAQLAQYDRYQAAARQGVG